MITSSSLLLYVATILQLQGRSMSYISTARRQSLPYISAHYKYFVKQHRNHNSAHRRCFSSFLTQRKECVSLGTILATPNDEQLEILEEITKLTGSNKPINPHSPKQVSMAIFGNSLQSTKKEFLVDIANGELPSLNKDKCEIASLVLKYRDLSRNSNKQQPVTTEERKRKITENAFLPTVLASNNNNIDDDGAADDFEKKSSSIVHSNPENNDEHVSKLGPMSERLSMKEEVVTNDGCCPYESIKNAHEKSVESLFEKELKISNFWKDALLELSRPSARMLVDQLDPSLCPMGYDPAAIPNNKRGDKYAVRSVSATATTAGKKGSFLAFCREQKEKYPDCVLLTRCGDFYESFGVDAIMLVEHCGLNSMGGKARAGCPYRNVQATLDCLTSKGFQVAVYEEAPDTDASKSGAGGKAGSKAKLKTRMLGQIVSPASPTYLYDLILLDNEGSRDILATSPAARPYIGVISTNAGYTLVDVSVEERCVRISERLTAESVACRLATYPPADPLLYAPSAYEYEQSTNIVSKNLPFLPSRSSSQSYGPGSRLRIKIIPPTLIEDPQNGIDDLERASNAVLSTLLQMTELKDYPSNEDKAARMKDFTLISSSKARNSAAKATKTNPLHFETALQLGLMDDRAIPSLISYVLPDSAPASTRRFIKRHLLIMPPPIVCGAMATLVLHLKEGGTALPPLAVPPLGKVLTLLRAGQASAEVYAEILNVMSAAVIVIDTYEVDKNCEFLKSLMTLLEYESGLAAEPYSLKSRCLSAITTIEKVIGEKYHVVGSGGNKHYSINNDDDMVSDLGDLIPIGFLERNEAIWRGRVRPDIVEKSYAAVQNAVERLADAVAQDFWGMSREEFLENQSKPFKQTSPIFQDVFNNLIAIKIIPAVLKEENEGDDDATKSKYFHPRDRNGKLIMNRFTTERVQSALSEYVATCDQARRDVSNILAELSQNLYDEGHIPAFVQAAHANLILSSAFYHTQKARTSGWSMAKLHDDAQCKDLDIDDSFVGKNTSAGFFEDVWPYWMDRSEAVANSFDINGMFLLTAPNMSGKSTLMRSTAAAALLSVCGFCAPLGSGSKIRRFDNIFVRGASADVPTERKSAFGAEMGDVAALMRNCGNKSLVFVDELGRGTSPRDGTRLSGAILEAMAKAGMSGIFATHLHDVLRLPLESSYRIRKKQMAINEKTDSGDSDSSQCKWTYRLVDGECTDSMALITAAQFGLSKDILDRAEELTSYLPGEETVRKSWLETETKNPKTRTQIINNINLSEENFQKVSEVLEEVAEDQPYIIPPLYNPPASLEGKSCVYVLQLDEDHPRRYYVGETDSFYNRLVQHRKKGGVWSGLRAMVVPILDGGKSQARAIESLVIQKLAKSGFPLYSTTDGRSIRSKRS